MTLQTQQQALTKLKAAQLWHIFNLHTYMYMEGENGVSIASLVITTKVQGD